MLQRQTGNLFPPPPLLLPLPLPHAPTCWCRYFYTQIIWLITFCVVLPRTTITWSLVWGVIVGAEGFYFAGWIHQCIGWEALSGRLGALNGTRDTQSRVSVQRWWEQSQEYDHIRERNPWSVNTQITRMPTLCHLNKPWKRHWAGDWPPEFQFQLRCELGHSFTTALYY